MAEIIPFSAVRYNVKRLAAPLADVVAPPYDVISATEQTELYDIHPYNVVRLILGREEDKYENANYLFRKWLADGILTTDPTPSIYVYRQRFSDPLTGYRYPERLGLVCLLRIEEYSEGGVLPHENTLTKAKADRLELLKATSAQFESIYGLYGDPDRTVETFLQNFDDLEPVIESVDGLIGSSHSIERIGDINCIQVLAEMMRDKKIFIADGHHRYETALNYRREIRAAHPELAARAIAEDYLLITLTAFEDEGLLVLPTHRLVRNVNASQMDHLIEALTSEFKIENASPVDMAEVIESRAARGDFTFGIVLADGRNLLATLNTPADQWASKVPGPSSDAVKRLPVSLLQSLVLEKRLGIDSAALAAGGYVSYTRDAEEGRSKVASGEYQAAFMLGRPSKYDVENVSLAGDKMPQKSTFFFPKLLSGLLMRDLTQDRPDEVFGVGAK